MDKATDNDRPIIYLFAPQKEFVRKYFEQQLTDYITSDNGEGADYGVMLSSVEVYDVDTGINLNELNPVKPGHALVDAEERFTDNCKRSGIPSIILRCAATIGTGMNGWPMEMARRIYNGSYLAVKGNEGCRSTIHASDIPKAALAALQHPGIYNLTDGNATKTSDLANALAWRIGQKRIFSISPKWYRLLFGKRRLTEECRTLTFSSEKLRSVTGFNPVTVTDYLTTHIYDEKSI